MQMQVIHLLTAHESPEFVMIPSSVRQLFSLLVMCSISGQLGQHDPGIRTGVLQVSGGQTWYEHMINDAIQPQMAHSSFKLPSGVQTSPSTRPTSEQGIVHSACEFILLTRARLESSLIAFDGNNPNSVWEESVQIGQQLPSMYRGLLQFYFLVTMPSNSIGFKIWCHHFPWDWGIWEANTWLFHVRTHFQNNRNKDDILRATFHLLFCVNYSKYNRDFLVAGQLIVHEDHDSDRFYNPNHSLKLSKKYCPILNRLFIENGYLTLKTKWTFHKNWISVLLFDKTIWWRTPSTLT